MQTGLSKEQLREIVGSYVMNGQSADDYALRDCVKDLREHAHDTGDLNLAILARCAEARAEQILEEYTEDQSRRKFGQPRPDAVREAIDLLHEEYKYKAITALALAKSTNEAGFFT